MSVVVSLTSWKERIKTVSKTIFSIYLQCHCKIILTLSTDEFINKENDLPKELLYMVNEGFLEILWVKKNEKCFKKILYTLDKYRDIPIVSADDDCIYTENYVKILYDKWLTDKSAIWTYKKDFDNTFHKYNFGHGPACLYPPYCFKEYGLKFIQNPNILKTYHDDVYYGILANKLGIKINQALEDNTHVPYYFHDEIKALSKSGTMNGYISVKTCEQEIKI